MARKKANYPLIESLEIVSVAAEGKALGRYNDVVVFVPMAVPGDVVDVQVRSKRRRFMDCLLYTSTHPCCAPVDCLRGCPVSVKKVIFATLI